MTAVELAERHVPRPGARLLAIAAATTASAVAVAQDPLAARTAIAIPFFVVLAVLAVIDVEQRRLPNAIVVPAAIAVLAAQIVVSPDRAAEWVVASVAAFVGMLALALLKPGGLGMGDVKLALLLGAALGWDVLLALVIGTAAGALYALVLLARHGAAGRRMTFAYGPFLAAGAAIAFLIG